MQLLSSGILAILIGYLIGSIPAAYIIVKLSSQRDIRLAGSGNVGALNSFQVTRKKWVGIAVLLFDVCKGAAAVVVVSRFEKSGYPIQALAGLSAIVGHDFNIWLRFRGGRGLATALGVMLLLGSIFPLVWCLLWCITYKIWRDVHGGNVVATIITPILLFFLPRSWVEVSLWTPIQWNEMIWLCTALCMLILLRHADFIRGLIRTKRGQSSSDQ